MSQTWFLFGQEVLSLMLLILPILACYLVLKIYSVFSKYKLSYKILLSFLSCIVISTTFVFGLDFATKKLYQSFDVNQLSLEPSLIENTIGVGSFILYLALFVCIYKLKSTTSQVISMISIIIYGLIKLGFDLYLR